MIARLKRRVYKFTTIGPSHFHGSVWVGDHADAIDTHRHFDRIISVGEGATNYDTDEYIPLTPYDENQTEGFAQAVDTVRAAMADGKATLVHCHEGRERAPSVAITAIAAEENLSWSKASINLWQRRPLVEPPNELIELGERYLETV